MSITKGGGSVPRRDGTGPMGESMNSAGLGQGSGYRRGPGRNFTKDLIVSKTQKELLQEQKEQLEKRLADISKQLEIL